MEEEPTQRLSANPSAAVFLVVIFGTVILMVSAAVLSRNIQFPLVIIRCLDVIHLGLFPTSFLAFLIVVIRMMVKPPATSFGIEPRIRFCWENLPLKTITCFVIVFACIFVIDNIISSNLRNRVKAFLNEAADEVRVKVNDKFVAEPQDIVAILKKVRPFPAHHSHATTRIRIDVLTGNRSISLELGRDSQRQREYWVFYPALFSYTTKTEVGRIVTTLFDSY